MLKFFFFILLFTHTLFACALCGNSQPSYVTTYLKVNFADNYLRYIHTVWKFDKDTSAAMKQLYTEKISDYDKKRMYEGLESYSPPFMTSIIINDKTIPFKVENFNIYFKEKTVYIEFDLFLDQPLQASQTIQMIFVDASKTMLFLENLEDTEIINHTSYSVKKGNGFKVIKELLTTVNYVKLTIAQ